LYTSPPAATWRPRSSSVASAALLTNGLSKPTFSG
jgi:hypothetical protein